MGSTRRAYTEEYKAQSVLYVIDDGRSIAEVSRNIGVHEITLGKWVKKARQARQTEPAAQESLEESERLELIRLRQQAKDDKAKIAELQMQVDFAKKSSDLVRERKVVIFAAIADWADSGEFSVSFMCRELGVSRSGFYTWRSGVVSARAREELGLISLMRRLFVQARGNPGVRRMRAMLAAAGHRLSHKRVWRLMRAAGLKGRHPKAWKRTTIQGEKPVTAPDLIGRDFTASSPNRRWCGDITYVRTGQGWAYVATVIDLFSRAIVGYAVDTHMRTSLVTDALDMAVKRRRPPRNVIFHADRGTQYTSKEFAAFCRKNKIRRSLGRTGICYDNAVSESTFATYKKELIHTRPWWDLAELKEATIDWIENYFNTIRRHSTLHYLTPREYELGFREINQLAA